MGDRLPLRTWSCCSLLLAGARRVESGDVAARRSRREGAPPAPQQQPPGTRGHGARRRVRAVRRRGAPLPRYDGRCRGVDAGARPRRPGGRHRRAGPPPDSRLQPLLHRGAAGVRRGAGAPGLPRPGVPLQLGDRGQRGGAEAGAPLSGGDQEATRARRAGGVRAELSRPDLRLAQRHGAGQVPRRLRSAGRPGALPAVRRRGRRARRNHRQELRGDRRADPGRGGDQPAASWLPAGAAAHLQRHGNGADLRRDPDRQRPHRHLLRVRERRASSPTW